MLILLVKLPLDHYLVSEAATTEVVVATTGTAIPGVLPMLGTTIAGIGPFHQVETRLPTATMMIQTCYATILAGVGAGAEVQSQARMIIGRENLPRHLIKKL